MDIVSYILSRKYTQKTVEGLGAIKGSPCTVESIVDITGGKRITLGWEGTSGTKQTQSFDIMDGVDGVSITSAVINEQGHLIIHYSDGTSSDAGVIVLDAPVKSVNGKTGDVVLTTSDLANDSGFTTQTYVDTALASKADTSDLNDYVKKENDKSLMSTAEHNKLDGIESGAQKNVQSDWDQNDSSKDDFIKNKPTIPPTIIVDSELSRTSTNPVENKVVKAAIDTKANSSDLDNYVQKETGKGLSTEDYTTAEKTKLGGVETGAEVNTIVSVTVDGVPAVPDANRNINIATGGGSGGTSNYNALTHKPQVNGVELMGNKSLEDLGIEGLTTEQLNSLLAAFD